ncbi:MAG: class II aldolase [Alphaproteobacteria bacterium]|nr:class II aldolase [Alphaproteobacteria bacterium]
MSARDIIAIAQEMDAAGFAPSKSGNVSLRTAQGFLITPTGKPYVQLKPADILELDHDGRVLRGKLQPSSEWRFHASIYRARPDANAILHNHSPRATALSCARKSIPAFHYMIAIAGGADIRCAPYATFGTQELALHAVKALDGRKACLLANHGVIALGADLMSAWTIAREVENLAGQYLDLLAAGLKPVILSQAEMRRVLAKFADYGRA